MATTNRRQLLTGAAAYAAGAAIVAGGAALASEARSAALGISPALSRLLAEHALASVALDNWYDQVWNPAVEAKAADLEGPRHASVSKDLTRQEEALYVPYDAANDAILAFPVANVTDALAKLEYLGKVCGEDSDRIFRVVHADLARLGGEARA